LGAQAVWTCAPCQPSSPDGAEVAQERVGGPAHHGRHLLNLLFRCTCVQRARTVWRRKQHAGVGSGTWVSCGRASPGRNCSATPHPPLQTCTACTSTPSTHGSSSCSARARPPTLTGLHCMHQHALHAREQLMQHTLMQHTRSTTHPDRPALHAPARPPRAGAAHAAHALNHPP